MYVGQHPSADLRGARLEVLAVWSGTEQQRFAAVIRAFESETGVVVRYVPAGHDISDVLAERRAAHRLPDVAFIPQPGLLREYARDGVVVPLDPGTVGEVTRNYPSVWRELGTVDGRLYAVWFKAANKSLVWYDLGAFERAGVIPPGDLNGLVAVSRTFASRGEPAFSLGARDGWTLTDWFENVYLALAGPRRYDDLATHRIPWTDPTVKQALAAARRAVDADRTSPAVFAARSRRPSKGRCSARSARRTPRPWSSRETSSRARSRA